MSWLTALGLCVAGLAAIIIEFFVPAAGIIGILGVGSIVGGIVVAYTQYGTVIGSIYLIGAAIATPFVVILYFKLFPKSFVGRWLILGNRNANVTEETATGKDKTGVSSGSTVEAGAKSTLEALAGRTGTAVSALRPAGTARIDGIKYSVVTGGEFIESGSEVKVTRVRGNRIHVIRS